jgi:hypothetical protein
LILSRPPPPAELLFFDALTPVTTLKCTATSALFIDRAALAPGTPEAQAARDRLRQRLAILLPQVRLRFHETGPVQRYADRRAVAYDPDNLVVKRLALRRDVRLNKLEPHGLGVYQVVAAGDNKVIIATVKGPVKVSKDCIRQALDAIGPSSDVLTWYTHPPVEIQPPGDGFRKFSLLNQHTHVQHLCNAPNATLVPTSTLIPSQNGTRPL